MDAYISLDRVYFVINIKINIGIYKSLSYYGNQKAQKNF